MSDDMKHIFLANNVKLYSWPLTFRKVVRQQIWGEVVFLIPSFPQILSEFNNEKKYENCSTFAEVIVKLKVARSFWDTVYIILCEDIT